MWLFYRGRERLHQKGRPVQSDRRRAGDGESEEKEREGERQCLVRGGHGEGSTLSFRPDECSQ